MSGLAKYSRLEFWNEKLLALATDFVIIFRVLRLQQFHRQGTTADWIIFKRSFRIRQITSTSSDQLWKWKWGSQLELVCSAKLP